MDIVPELISARHVAEKLAAEIVPRFGSLHASDEDETFTALWDEHIRLRWRVSQTLRRWAVDLAVTNEEEDIFRQCFLRLAGAVEIVRRQLDGRHIAFLPSRVMSSRHLFEFLVIDCWESDEWPAEWLRHCSEPGADSQE
jgi:hypothetical protein